MKQSVKKSVQAEVIAQSFGLTSAEHRRLGVVMRRLNRVLHGSLRRAGFNPRLITRRANIDNSKLVR